MHVPVWGVVKTRNGGILRNITEYGGIWRNITEYGGISRNMAEYHGISRHFPGIYRNITKYINLNPRKGGTARSLMVAMRLFINMDV